jgi:hypothetical protein
MKIIDNHMKILEILSYNNKKKNNIEKKENKEI